MVVKSGFLFNALGVHLLVDLPMVDDSLKLVNETGAVNIQLNPNAEVRSAKHAKGRENDQQNRLEVVGAFYPRFRPASPSLLACFACLADCISESGLKGHYGGI